MPIKNSYYSILEVDRSASIDDIKKSYRKLVKKYHPDKNSGSEDLFRSIQEAYETLSDEDKRSVYDLKQEPYKKEIRTDRVKRGSDLSASIEIDIQDLFFGKSLPIMMTRKGLCPQCRGTGSEEKKTSKCAICRGTGLGSMSTIDQGMKCVLCHGIGTVPAGKKCSKCNGHRLVPEKMRNVIHLNWNNSSSVILKGCGNCFPGGDPGDLNINFRIKNDTIYSIKNSKVIRKLHVSPARAVLGGTVDLAIFGNNFKIEISPGSGNRTFIDVYGMGPHLPDGKRGDIEIQLVVNTPSICDMTIHEIELYREILSIEKGL